MWAGTTLGNDFSCTAGTDIYPSSPWRRYHPPKFFSSVARPPNHRTLNEFSNGMGVRTLGVSLAITFLYFIQPLGLASASFTAFAMTSGFKRFWNEGHPRCWFYFLLESAAGHELLFLRLCSPIFGKRFQLAEASWVCIHVCDSKGHPYPYL